MREVSCIGRCDVAPAAAVHERPLPIAELPQAVRGRPRGEEPPARAKREKRTWPNDPYADGAEMASATQR